MTTTTLDRPATAAPALSFEAIQAFLFAEARAG